MTEASHAVNLRAGDHVQFEANWAPGRPDNSKPMVRSRLAGTIRSQMGDAVDLQIEPIKTGGGALRAGQDSQILSGESARWRARIGVRQTRQQEYSVKKEPSAGASRRRRPSETVSRQGTAGRITPRISNSRRRGCSGPHRLQVIEGIGTKDENRCDRGLSEHPGVAQRVTSGLWKVAKSVGSFADGNARQKLAVARIENVDLAVVATR